MTGWGMISSFSDSIIKISPGKFETPFNAKLFWVFKLLVLKALGSSLISLSVGTLKLSSKYKAGTLRISHSNSKKFEATADKYPP